MKMVQKLSLIAMAITLAACNEKVSPELQQGAAVDVPDTTTPIPPTEYHFSIVNTSDALLNYKLHKTGFSNASKACEVRNTTGLNNDQFRADPAANDITCFMDAEELSLYHGGFKWEMQASKNTCDFVAYSPFGFYDRIPGDSTDTHLQINCLNETTNNTHVATAASALGIDITDSTALDLGCGDWASEGIPSATRVKFQETSDAELCRYNYKDGELEKCDIGTITVKQLQVAYTPANGTTPAVLTYQLTPRLVRCGGSVANCVKGPTKAISSSQTKVIQITQTSLNADFKKEYKYSGLNSETAETQASSVKSYANFRRNLASKNIDYIASSDGLYSSAWNSSTYGRTFDPMVADYFAANVQFDNSTPLISSTRIATEGARNNMWNSKPLAGDPYLGLAGRVNPFYTFYCYDTALDIKARIRVVVREWDRIFPGSTELEWLSDLYKGATARQDIPFLPEMPDDNDPTIPFNDFTDWDDWIYMSRTPGSFSPATIYAPEGTATYPDGWFNPANFTNNAY